MKTISPKIAQVTIAIFVVLVAVGIWWTRLRDDSPKFEDANARKMRWRIEADAAARSACSNQLGFYRIIDVHTLTSDSDPNKWTAFGTVEVITGATGVARKNVNLEAQILMGDIFFFDPARR